MRVLVTGAGGMLGHDLVSAADAGGIECAALTRAELDITDAARVDAVVGAVRPEVIVNCAAWTDVDAAESESESATAVNGDGAGNVARSATRAGAWVIQISSDYVFDGNKREPYVEADPVSPLSAYGRSKLAGERAVAAAAPDSHTVVRSSWLFGSHGRCFPATILRLARERDELRVVDDQVGCPTFTGHLAQALLTLCERRPVGVVHVAGGGSCSWFEFALQIVAEVAAGATVLPCSTAEMPRAAQRPAYSVMESERDAPQLPDWRLGLQAYLTAGAVAR